MESGQAKTTLPFGWDDVSDLKTLREVAVASFNQVSSNFKFLVNLYSVLFSNMQNLKFKTKTMFVFSLPSIIIKLRRRTKWLYIYLRSQQAELTYLLF